MNHIKTILFLLLSLAVGIGIGRGYVYWKNHPNADFTHKGDPPLITGIGDAPGWRGFVVANPADLSKVIDASEAAYATTVGIEYSPAWTSDLLTASVHAIHERRFRAMLLPPPVFTAGNPYPAGFKIIATQAQAAGFDFLCISWLNQETDPDYWIDQSIGIHSVFQGRVIFAATPAILTGISCWDAGDLIGAIGPVPLPRRLPHAKDKVTLKDERVAWDCSLTTLEFLARAHGKKLALLHMNVPQEVSARLPTPGTADQPSANTALQEMLYEALLTETKGRARNTEILLFNWGADGNAPNNVPGLLSKVSVSWDPKTSRSARTGPATTAEGFGSSADE